MLVGIAIFVAGSTLCGAAQSMEMMVVFRALQGVGGGAIYALAFIIVGILYPAEKRARMQGIISSIWGLASILGPLAGGIIVEHWSWRWIFFVNLPVTAAASALIVAGLHEEAREKGTAPRLDWLGTATLLLALMLLFYALAQGAEAQRPLNATLVAAMAAGTAVLGVFFMIERRAEEPVIPLDLFHVYLFTVSTVVATLASMGVFGAISYLPLYLQGVLGISASRAGLVLLVLSIGWTGGSLLGGHLIDRKGYRFVTVAGMSLIAAGYGFFIAPEIPFPVVGILISAVAIGSGMGMANLTTLVAAQSAVWTHRIGVATSTIMLFRTFGGAFSVSLMGTVLLSRMHSGLDTLGGGSLGGLPAGVREKIANPQNLLEPATRALIPAELLPPLTAILGDAIWYAFAVVFVLMLIGAVASLSIGAYTPANTPRPKRL
jgi:EmrB/QacA subfamily drug resistance transporter